MAYKSTSDLREEINVALDLWDGNQLDSPEMVFVGLLVGATKKLHELEAADTKVDLLRTCMTDVAEWFERTDRGGTAHHRRMLHVLARTKPEEVA
jgi:hypothetical protein